MLLKVVNVNIVLLHTPVLILKSSTGIGQGRVTDNLKGAFEEGIIDDALHVPDEDSVEMVREID